MYARDCWNKQGVVELKSEELIEVQSEVPDELGQPSRRRFQA
jgi:hypothetical protein